MVVASWLLEHRSVTGNELGLARGAGRSRDHLGRLHAAQRPPRLCGAEWDALVRVTVLRPDVDAALDEALLDHGVHVHERLDVQPLDPLGNELPESAPITEHRLTGEPNERAHPEV